jgi:tRNA A37 methylthiotransferase MiaB
MTCPVRRGLARWSKRSWRRSPRSRLRLSSVDGSRSIRCLHELIASEPRLMPHLHLSLQHGDDLILKRMKRRHSRAKRLPHWSIGCARAGPTSRWGPT